MGSDVLNEMASFDFKSQMIVTILNDDEETETTSVNSYFFQNSTNKKNKDEFRQKPKVPNQEIKRSTVLRLMKNKICSKTTDDTIKEGSIQKKKKNSNKSKKPNKKTSRESKETMCKDKSLNPIEMEPVIEDTPLNTTGNKYVIDNNNDESKRLDVTETENKNEESNKYINDLLAKVSESLIHILEAYYKHVAHLQKITCDSIYIQESKRRFARLKLHFFQLSYCTTNILILSRESDTKFIDDFLKNTVKLAEMKYNMKLTVQQIQPLYYEFISWVKQKKELKNVSREPVPSNYNTPLLRKQLSEPSVPLSVSSISAQVIPKVSIHNTDSENREIRISLEPNLQNSGTFPNHPLVTSQQYPNTTNQTKLHDAGNIYNTPKYYNYQMNLNTNEVTHYRNLNVSDFLAPIVNSKYSAGLQDRCMLANCSCQKQSQGDISNPMNIRFPNPPILPSYEQSFRWKDENMNSDGNNVDTTRSSISTDSGFISPQQSSALENVAPFVEDTLNVSGTPLITHVTSLNPKALQIVEGSCYVCGAPTKKKCLGCLSVYYCSYLCQRFHWSQHMDFCKQKSASRTSQNLSQFVQ